MIRTVTEKYVTTFSQQANGRHTGESKSGIRLLLICHAEGMHDRYSHLDNENGGLTAVGWEQSDVLSGWFRSHEVIDVLVSDSLLQSRLTAQRIGQALGLPVTVYRDLPACPHDEWHLPGANEVDSEHLSELHLSKLQPEHEPYSAFHVVLIAALDKLLAENWGKTVALVTCGDSIATVIRHLFGAHSLDVRLDHTSVSEICHTDGHWHLSYVNRYEHLPTPVVESNTRPVPEMLADSSEDLAPILRVYNRSAGADLVRKMQDDRKRIRKLLNFADLGADLRVLDVGSGIGILTLMLAEDGARSVVGVDVSPDMLEQAEYLRLSQPSQTSARVSYRLAPAQALPFHDESFDVVTCRLVLQHTRKPEQIIRQLVRVLKPGGVLVIAELLSVDNPVKRATQNAIEERRNPSHCAARSAEQYDKLLAEADLFIEAKEIVSFDRELEEWLGAYQTDENDTAIVREMIEAGLETDAAGINARRQGETIWFEQRMYHVKAIKAGAIQ